MRDHSTTQELELIVGPKRSSSSARRVARAERELALRAGGEQAAFQRKLRLSANACVIVGALCVVWPIVLLLAFKDVSHHPASTSDPSGPFLFRHFDQLFTFVGVLQAFCGALLLLGGLGTRRGKRYGPGLVSAVLLIAVVYVFAFSAAALQAVLSGPAVFAVGFIGVMLINDAIFLILLWLPFRFFTSPRVREQCRGTAV